MTTLRAVATLTSKGQITLPKPIRQALGVDLGGKVAFTLEDGGRITVQRVEAQHEDPAIGRFLDLLARDIETGRNIHDLPQTLIRTMLEHAGHDAPLGEDFDDDVEL